MKTWEKDLFCDLAATESRCRVGIFDSGVGGLSILRELLKQDSPPELFYVADQQNAPYGHREMDTIRQWCEKIGFFLAAQGARVIILACNSASAAALYPLREMFPDIRFVGMEPAVKPAATLSSSGRIAILATAATFAGKPYRNLAARYGNGKCLIECACPELVALVENGDRSGSEAAERVGAVLAPLLEADVDQIVLGCTHFSFLKPLIQTMAGRHIQVIDPADAVARQAVRMLQSNADGMTGTTQPQHRLFTTGDVAVFKQQVEELLARRLPVLQAVWR